MEQIQHLAVIMDGNGRWARQRGLPRVAGHDVGVEALRRLVQAAIHRAIPILTVFAFSTENWRRSETEIGYLLDTVISRSLAKELPNLQKWQVKVVCVGSRQRFSQSLIEQLDHLEQATAHNQGLRLNIALDYGGRWEIVEACRELLRQCQNGQLTDQTLEERYLQQALVLGDCPPPDLLIRTGGERRISNFLLWHLAYTELYFTEVYWPDFDEQTLAEAIEWYRHCERRFGSNVS